MPIPAWLCDELAKHLAPGGSAGLPLTAQSESGTDGKRATRLLADRGALVFATSAGTPLSGHNFRSRIWVPALDAAKAQRGALHDLRHSYASYLVQAGRSLEEVKALLGHESIRTSERYGHMRPDHGFDAVSVLERPSARRA